MKPTAGRGDPLPCRRTVRSQAPRLDGAEDQAGDGSADERRHEPVDRAGHVLGDEAAEREPEEGGEPAQRTLLPGHRLGRGAFTDGHGVLLSIGSSRGEGEVRGSRRASVMPAPRHEPAPTSTRRRGRAPFVDEDHDAEGDEPHAPQDVTEEVGGVDTGQVERREHTGEHEHRRGHTQHLEPASGVATTECDDDEHGPRGGEQVPDGLAEAGAEHVAHRRERVAGVVGDGQVAARRRRTRSRGRGSANAAGRRPARWPR